MKQQILVLLLGMAPLASQADVVTEQQAEATAFRFFQGEGTRASRAAVKPLQLVWKGETPRMSRSVAGSPAYYVYNRGNQEGFVIVAGDDAVKPILGYALEGSFGTENMPENLRGWMAGLATGIAEMRSQQMEPSAEVKQAWQELTVGNPVVELVTPDWNQTEPYNALCPKVTYSDGSYWNAYTGCTITATAIVMGYHQWPDQGVGKLKGYQTAGLDVWVEGVNLDDHVYDWANMPEINGNILSYDKNSAEYQLQEAAIAPLMRDLGVMLHARYDYSGTSAMLDILSSHLPRRMKYHEGIAYIQHRFFSSEVWCDILKKELDRQRPIAFAGYGLMGDGHAFVLDGYDDMGLFSVNWGWGGVSNGYFDMDSMYPSQQGAGGTTSGYAQDQEAVLRIQPKRPDATFDYYEDMIFALSSVMGSPAKPGLNIQNETFDVTAGSSFTVSVGLLLNWGSDKYEGQMKLAVTDGKGRIKQDLYTTPGVRFLNPGSVVMPMDEARDFVPVTLEKTVDAGDRLRLLYLSKDGEWQAVKTKEKDVPWEIVLKEGADVPDVPEGVEVNTLAGTNLETRAIAVYSSDVPTVPSDASVEAYYADLKETGVLVLHQIEPKGDRVVIPAHTGVILATEGVQTFTMEETALSADVVPADNLLRPAPTGGTEVDGAVNAYGLVQQHGEMVFSPLGEDRSVAAHGAYLAWPEGMNPPLVQILFFGCTGIDSTLRNVAPQGLWYDLSGRPVDRPLKGVYIQDGKKYIGK